MTADRQELKQQSKNALIDEVLRLRRVLRQQLQAGPELGDQIVVQGVVLAGTGQPAVQWRCGEASGQWSTLQEATDFGKHVIVAAVEAERDAATVAFLQAAGFDDDHVWPFIGEMRRHRVHFTGGLSEHAAPHPGTDGEAGAR